MNVVITGASNGIGRDLALLIAENYDCRIIAVSRNREKLEQLKRDSVNSKFNQAIIPVPFDLRSEDYLPILDEVKKAGHIDILINNAAVLIKKELKEIKPEEIRESFEINFIAPARLIKALHRFMGRETKSHIVNISSMGGFQGSLKFPGMSTYSATKAALINLTETLAVEFAEDNISVNCLALGSVQTEMLSKAFPDYKAPLKSFEMASFIMDFAVNGSKYFNGKIIPVALSNP